MLKIAIKKVVDLLKLKPAQIVALSKHKVERECQQGYNYWKKVAGFGTRKLNKELNYRLKLKFGN